MKKMKIYECNMKKECNNSPYCSKNGGPCYCTSKIKYAKKLKPLNIIESVKIRGIAKPLTIKRKDDK